MASSEHLPNGIICTPEQYARSTHDPSIHCLTRGESIGLTIVAQAGLVSLIAVSYVFTIILRNVFWRVRNVSRERLRIFNQPMDMLMCSLFFADALQAIGAAMDIKWIQDGKVEVGTFCNAQGIIQSIGETGVAMTTLMIAVYTFLGVWMGKSIRSISITRAVLGSVWLFIGLMVIIGNTINRGEGKARYESPTPYWCWISQDYLIWRIVSEYLWFWITLGFSFLVYIPLCLWIRGNIVIHDPAWWKFHFQHADKSDPNLRYRRSQSLVMAAYPLVYCVSILPLSVVRWIGFVQESNGGTNKISSTATFTVISIYGLSGFCNVILLLTTKPEAELFGKPTHFSWGRAPSPLMPTHELESSTSTVEPRRDSKDNNELGRLPSRSSGGWERGL